MTSRPATGHNVLALIQHLLLLFVSGVAAYGFSLIALLLLDGRCVAKGYDVAGCSPVRLHLAQFLPVYAALVAVLIGVIAGVRLARNRTRLEKVFTLDWLVLGTGTLLALLLH